MNSRGQEHACLISFILKNSEFLFLVCFEIWLIFYLSVPGDFNKTVILVSFPNRFSFLRPVAWQFRREAGPLVIGRIQRHSYF